VICYTDNEEGGKDRSEPVFINLLRSPGIDSQPAGIDLSKSIPGLHKCLQIRAQEKIVFYRQARRNNGFSRAVEKVAEYRINGLGINRSAAARSHMQ
jgi:hypothetical protein